MTGSPGRSCCSREGQGRESNLAALVFRVSSEGGGGDRVNIEYIWTKRKKQSIVRHLTACAYERDRDRDRAASTQPWTADTRGHLSPMSQEQDCCQFIWALPS